MPTFDSSCEILENEMRRLPHALRTSNYEPQWQNNLATHCIHQILYLARIQQTQRKMNSQSSELHDYSQQWMDGFMTIVSITRSLESLGETKSRVKQS